MLIGLLLAGKYQENCLPRYILSAKYWTDSAIEYEIDSKYAKGNNVDANNEDVNGDDYGPSTLEMYIHTCSYIKYGQKCTNRAKHGGNCNEHYLESLI